MTEEQERNFRLTIQGLILVLVLLVIALVVQIIIIGDDLAQVDVAGIGAISAAFLATIGVLSLVAKRGRSPE